MASKNGITPDKRNANRGTERGRYMLETSLRELGAGRSILLDKNNNVIAGNKTLEVSQEIGLDDILVIETDGTKLVAVKRMDLDITDPTGKARKLAYADNRVSEVDLSFDFDMIKQDISGGLDLTDFWFDWELGIIERDTPDGQGDENKINESPLPGGVPNTIWPSDNDWGIPLLDITRQADLLDMPFEAWGAKARGTRAGTLHFYTEDYRFNAVWDNPSDPLKAGPVSAVEPNYTIKAADPLALTVWRTYQKRWLARYWQSQGVRVFVDLNVSAGHDALNLTGVPKGWRAYATRGYSEQIDALEAELGIAEKHAGDSVLFLVYGGGKSIKQWSKGNAGRGVIWIPEDADLAKGKYTEELTR